MTRRFPAPVIEATAKGLLMAAGLSDAPAAVVASTLKDAELLGKVTHGLWLLDLYLSELAHGAMAKTAELTVLSDHGSVLVWDGHLLPGAWLIHRAMEEAFQRLETHPVVTVTIRRSHHVGCHAVYLQQATARDVIMLLSDTNPGFKVVAPFGGKEPLYSPTPISAGIPTDEEPIIIDFSLSSSSLGRATLHHRRGEKLSGKWLIDHLGNPTDDPKVLFTNPPGSILPLGGPELGYKGFGLALMVYALSAGLTGYGAAEAQDGGSSAVFLQLLDPSRFAGRDALRHTMSSFAAACRASAPVPGSRGVRLPGEGARERRARALKEGVDVAPECVSMLRRWSQSLGVPCALIDDEPTA